MVPEFDHSVDLWVEVEHWCRKWKQRCELEWVKENPEMRDALR